MLCACHLGLTRTETKMLIRNRGIISPKTNADQINKLLQQLHPVSDLNNELIRIGPNGDGGYLVPNDFSNITACFSPGVSYKSTFEKHCADLGMKIFLADKSVDHPGESHPSFQFTPKFIGSLNNGDFMTLDNWVKLSLPQDDSSDLLLQIDIEGTEYEVFHNISEALLNRFRILVVEFHNLDLLWIAPFFTYASRAFDKILQTHICLHIHPNNSCDIVNREGIEIPPVAEFTFIRRDRIRNYKAATQFPHKFDVDNTNRSSIHLPRCWYKQHAQPTTK